MKRPFMTTAYTVHPCANGFIVTPHLAHRDGYGFHDAYVCETVEALREIMLRLNERKEDV